MKVNLQPSKNLVELELSSAKEDEEAQNSELCITDNMSMMCPICHFFMNKTVCATCGHMFCQYWLDEYLIFKESCPVCEKSIRRGKITRWCIADSAIEKMLTFSKGEYIQEWEAKKKAEDDYYDRKKLILNADVKSWIIIDARDSEYIWCKAEIVAIIESKNEENSLLIHYIGWDNKYDEVLSISSPRIANKGFYSDRDDIPHYQETDNKSKKPVINLPLNSDKVEIIEELKKDWFEDSNGDVQFANESSIGVYENLIERVTGNNNHSTLLQIPNGRGGSDARIRINALNLERFRNGFNRNHF